MSYFCYFHASERVQIILGVDVYYTLLWSLTFCTSSTVILGSEGLLFFRLSMSHALCFVPQTQTEWQVPSLSHLAGLFLRQSHFIIP